MRIFLMIFFLLAFAGCGFTPFLYKADIVQGNIVTEAQLSRIQLGMTRREVESILGSQQLDEPFHNNRRSDYVYEYFSGESNRHYQRGVTIFYNQAGLVERVEKQDLQFKHAIGR